MKIRFRVAKNILQTVITIEDMFKETELQTKFFFYLHKGYTRHSLSQRLGTANDFSGFKSPTY